MQRDCSIPALKIDVPATNVGTSFMNGRLVITPKRNIKDYFLIVNLAVINFYIYNKRYVKLTNLVIFKSDIEEETTHITNYDHYEIHNIITRLVFNKNTGEYVDRIFVLVRI